MSDQFAREVDEDLRSEYLKRLWDRFGLIIISVAVLIVVMTAGYRGYAYLQERDAQTAGDAFMNALELAENGDEASAIQAFEEIAASDHNGYAALARFSIATELANDGDLNGAIAQFDQISELSDSDEFQALADLRAAMLEVDTASLDEMRNRLGVLANPDSEWRHTAREFIALTAYRTGDLETATSTLDLILNDAEANPTVRSRAEILKTLINDSQ